MILDVRGLSVRFGAVPAVNDLSFTLARGETLAVVGESGSGKSVTSLALMRLLPRGTAVTGSALLDGQDLLALPEAEMRRLRGGAIAMVFQEPMTSLNPTTAVGAQVAEAVRLHRGMDAPAAREEAARLLDLVGIPAARQRLDDYPHHLSGGMRQRVMIAMALAGDPQVLIADEPTTALDVTIQAQILDLLKRLQQSTGMAMVFITHNLGVVAEVADRVLVMCGGRAVEQAPLRPLFRQPLMPYTAGLLRSVPRMELAGQRRGPLPAIPGNVPDPRAMPPGCVFHPRCAHHQPGRCDAQAPVLEPAGEARAVRCLRWKELAA
ncbi:ABC transporter ATP-binding protein [Roseococcus sp. DSY-14]|uniref:ABC transporter ATP-binding protein n=1 Tax=Roseococcus sp. DSY-14 TaxID=3369650 RepID=UPI00387AE56B